MPTFVAPLLRAICLISFFMGSLSTCLERPGAHPAVRLFEDLELEREPPGEAEEHGLHDRLQGGHPGSPPDLQRKGHLERVSDHPHKEYGLPELLDLLILEGLDQSGDGEGPPRERARHHEIPETFALEHDNLLSLKNRHSWNSKVYYLFFTDK